MPKKEVAFAQVVAALVDEQRPFPPSLLNRLSDLQPADFENLRRAWGNINVERRVALLEDLERISENDTLVSFEDLALLAAKDTDPRVRTLAVSLLWDYEDRHIIPVLTTLLKSDQDKAVRANAASALGKYIYLGELDKLQAGELDKVEEALLEAYANDPEGLVRRRALESLGYSSRENISNLIQQAYDSSDEQWLESSLFAMGRSAQSELWEQAVLKVLSHPSAQIRAQAAWAAGELQLESARDPLLEIVHENDDEPAVISNAIWALSLIGGESVRETLELLRDQTEEDEEADFISDALDNLDFTENRFSLGLLSYDEPQREDLDFIMDVDDEEDDAFYDALDDLEESGKDESAGDAGKDGET
jgi:HEAT repeat protein